MRQQYEFRIRGQLSERAATAVGDYSDLQVTLAPPETVLYGPVEDQAHLNGILAFLEGLGLPIVSVHQLPETYH